MLLKPGVPRPPRFAPFLPRDVIDLSKVRIADDLATPPRSGINSELVIVVEPPALPTATKPLLRLQYEAEVRALRPRVRELRLAGLDAEGVARALSAERDAVKMKYRNFTPPDMLAKINTRNLRLYANELGPTVDYLREQGKAWWRIIRGATRPGGKDFFQ